ncbi:PREDICTED: cas scaffolding protein family member 4 isoform X2 [Colobus angolensis palliatus]|uniref:cas scaffolding protein family member 4 isoform X2 n=1 Tax=Colobus angolensis palliatus TaxID=336983 RepID=UPI0005F3ADEE|nr:PREDICTED: cas scaffolding protein family member 4 isoform X2 [Colobus angolensis palliatus]
MKGTGVVDGAPKALLARALYDNCPDCSDELAFSRGDILTILEQHVPESEGWWKCLLHGRQGLAPANRLQILTEVIADRPCPPFPRGPEEAPASSEETYQAIITLPRPARASLPTLPSQVYDVPTQHRGPVVLKEPEKQQLYDIPASPKKAGLHPPAGQASGQGVPLISVTTLRKGSYSTLPSPQKSEWVYDTPVSPGKASIRHTPLPSFAEESRPHALPSSSSTFHNPPSGRARSLTPQLNTNVPMQKKLSLPEIPSYGFLVPRDTFPLDEDVSYKVPSSFLIPRVEQQNTKSNIYDIPKAISSVSQAGKELAKAKEVSENSTGHNSSWFSRRTTSRSPEPDRLSGSSSDSRASIVSSCSTTSTDSSSSSSSEESAKELSLDLDVAKETVMSLQHKVVSSVAGLMLFVSRKWRFRDYLEANIDAIHRSTEHIEESVREFLDFARGVHGTACNLTDSNLQNRIRDQMQTISNSYRILLETKESLDNRNWPLEVLVTDNVQNSPDDLERFVMVARMLPEDIKRFASIVIANGRLLFKQNCEKEETVQLTPNAEFKCGKCIQPPQRETESHQKSTPSTKQREDEHSSELLKKNRANICGQTPGPLIPQPSSQQTPERKHRLSEHCRLYFGALFKAISAFHGGLSSSQPAEIITQSKLVITVGQKLVDTLCVETQERDVRNEILRGSSHLCSLLKDVALATKNAVLTYPSPAALGHLQAEAEKLERHTRQFRGTLG